MSEKLRLFFSRRSIDDKQFSVPQPTKSVVFLLSLPPLIVAMIDVREE